MIVWVLGIFAIVIIIYFIWMNKNSSHSDSGDIITFNAPYQIHIDDLLDILCDIHKITEPEANFFIRLHCPNRVGDLPPPEIPFEKYFKIDDKTCTVTKFERTESGDVALTLRFIVSPKLE